MSTDEESGSTSQEATGVENQAVSNLIEALAQALKKTGKQECLGAAESSMFRNIKPPRPYTPSQSFKTWLSQFMEYAKLVKIPEEQRRAHLINSMDEKAYKAVELLKLPTTLPFDEFIARLKIRFESARTTGDYKLQLRSRHQKPGEGFESFALMLC